LFAPRRNAKSNPVEAAEYHLMDAVEQRMWWYPALRRIIHHV